MDSKFVPTILAMCGVTSVSEVRRKMLSEKHMQCMLGFLSPTAVKLLDDACLEADQQQTAVYCDGNRFDKSKLDSLTEDEALLVQRIYGSQGRELAVTPHGMVVSPARTVLEKKRLSIAS